MKPWRPLSLLAGIVLLGGVAKFNAMPAHAQASLPDDTASTARTAAYSPPPSTFASANEVPRNTAGLVMHVPVAGQDTEQGKDPAPGAAAAKPALNPLWRLPLERLSITRERPIFSPSRRPPPPAPTFVAPVAVRQSKPPEPERPTIALVGTILGTDDGYRMAIFLDTSTQDVLHLHIGENYHGWVVSLIDQREASLMKNGERAVLELSGPGATLSPLRSSRDAMLDRVWKVGAD